LAFEHLPTLAVNREAAREISGLFASLVGKNGTDEVRKRLEAVRCKLQAEVAALFDKWFEIRNRSGA
jgi:hypothetical protein